MKGVIPIAIDRSHAVLRDKWEVEPFPVPDQGMPLRDEGLPADLELILFERNGVYRTLVMREMAYHHIAQGELGSEPYIVSF